MLDITQMQNLRQEQMLKVLEFIVQRSEALKEEIWPDAVLKFDRTLQKIFLKACQQRLPLMGVTVEPRASAVAENQIVQSMHAFKNYLH